MSDDKEYEVVNEIAYRLNDINATEFELALLSNTVLPIFMMYCSLTLYASFISTSFEWH